jgi:hypothetical protein
MVVGIAAAGGFQARSNERGLGPTIAVGLPVAELAADGTFAAANLRNDETGSGRIIVWNAQTGRVITAYTNDYGDIETLSELTVAGNRVAWVLDLEEGEMSSELSLQLFDLTSQRRITVANVWTDGVSLSLAQLGNVAGKDSLLVFNTWQDGIDHKPFQQGVSNRRLWRVDPAGRTPLRAGPSAMAPVDVNANEILVKRADGHLTLLKADGSIVRQFSFARGYVRSARLDGSTIAVQTSKTLVLYDTSSGRAERRWPTTGLEDVEGGIAVSRSANGIHLLRLADSHRATVRLKSVVAARLTTAGLFYATESPSNDQLGFIPASALLASLG